MRDLAAGPRRFVELQRMLPGISTEQLRSRLNRMVADGLLTRQRYREVPPRVDYELTERARALMPVLGELARWGYEWAWSAPRAGEAIDVLAILRLAPGLVGIQGSLNGVVELALAGDDENEVVYTLTAGAHSELSPGPASRADARIAGSQESWVAALGPQGERGGLSLSGDAGLAERTLALLAGGAAAGRAAGAVAA